MKKLKIRTKIMLLFTMLSAILLGALVPTVYSSVAASLRQTLQARLQMAVSQVKFRTESCIWIWKSWTSRAACTCA